MTWRGNGRGDENLQYLRMLDAENPLMTERPFRAPDMRITPASLVGGGMRPETRRDFSGTSGVLFLDELRNIQDSVWRRCASPWRRKQQSW